MAGGWRRVVLAAALLAARPALAQARPTLHITLPPPDSLATQPPLVRATHVLGVSSVRELVDHGFPARLTWRLELWSTAGVFNRRLRSTTWDVVLRFDPVRRVYEAVRVVDDRPEPLGAFSLMADAVSAIERDYRPAIVAPRDARGALYYTATLTLEMISVGDLDELGRWVRGDLEPVVRGRRNPGTALGRGARTLFSRLLGGERRTIDARSDRFVVP